MSLLLMAISMLYIYIIVKYPLCNVLVWEALLVNTCRSIFLVSTPNQEIPIKRRILIITQLKILVADEDSV